MQIAAVACEHAIDKCTLVLDPMLGLFLCLRRLRAIHLHPASLNECLADRTLTFYGTRLLQASLGTPLSQWYRPVRTTIWIISASVHIALSAEMRRTFIYCNIARVQDQILEDGSEGFSS